MPSDRDSGTPSNLEVIVHLTQSIAQKLAAQAHVGPADTCTVVFSQQDDYRFLEHAFGQGLQQIPCIVFSAPEGHSHSTRFEVQPLKVGVAYENMFRSSLFGEKQVERFITVELSARVVKSGSGEILFSGVLSEHHKDTVAVGMVARLELPTIQATQASLPNQDFFDRIVEPIVIVGAAAVIIYLLFSIRS